MEFKYRDNVESPPYYQHSASDPTVFRDQPYLPRPENWRGLMLPDPNIRYMFEREIEKERIRKEIIAEEIMRRRELEDEVRRELALERRMAFCNAADEHALPLVLPSMRESALHNHFSPYDPNAQFSLNKPPRREDELFGKEPTLHNHFVGAHKSDAQLSLNKPLRREEELFGSSRASVSKRRYEASVCCALCQQKMATQHDLKAHLQGKKHSKKVTEMLEGGNTKNVHPSSDSKKQKVEKPNKERQLWCKTCDVHASSEKQLDTHLKGKKHLSKEGLARKKDIVKGKKRLARKGAAREEDDDVAEEGSVSVVAHNGKKNKYAAEYDVESRK